MFLAYKYAKKKTRERKERKAADTAVGTTQIELEPVQNNGSHERLPSDATAANLVNKEQKSESISTEQAVEKKRLRNYRIKVLLGLVMPFTLQALDTTIIASALPYIAEDFGKTDQLNWIISAFNLTSAAFLPFWAQLTDIFGRHASLHASLVVMLVGSAICTGAPTSSFPVLLLGRALQGVGAAGITVTVRTILADRVSLSDYAVNWTLFAIIAAVGSSVGSVIGGYLTSASWRWCFAINLPVAVVAIVTVLLLLRHELLGPQQLPELEGRRGTILVRLGTVDFGGQLLFLWGIGLLILALTWGGSTYGWSSAAVLAPLVLGAVLSLGWLLYEYLMAPGRLLARMLPLQRSMMPWELLTQRDIGLLFAINFMVGMAMFSVLYFMELYFALVEGKSSSQSGISLLYYLPGLAVGAYSSMFFSNVWPRQTMPSLMLGGISSAVGITVLAWAIHVERTSVIYGMMSLTGYGVGIRMNPGSLHGLAYFPHMTVMITCMVSFAMPFGGTVALTVMSSVFNNKVEDGAKRAITWAYFTMIPFMWLCVLMTTFLGNVWIAKDGSHEVVNGAYLWSLVTRRGLARERRSRSDQGSRLAPTHGAEASVEDKSPKDARNIESSAGVLGRT